MAQGFTFSISRAPRAAAATPSRSLSMEASTAAMTAPSTKGALLSSTRPAPSGSCSIAIWVLSTALPRSTSTSTPSAPRTSWIAPAMAVASVPSRPSAVPPATAILTLPWVIWAASSRTPSASCRLCETRTRLTVPISPGHDLDGMGGFRAGPMLDLQAAGFAVGEHGIGAGRLDGLEEATSDFHGQVVLLDLDAERAGNSAAPLVDFVEMDPWDQAQQPRRRVSHAVRLEMAGCVVEQPRFHRLEGDIELTGLVQHPQVFADVIGARADRRCAGNLEQVTVVVLEHQPARRRAGDDVDVGGKTAEPADVLGAVFPCQVDVGVDDGRNSAALLLGDDDVDAVALEDVHDHFAQTPLVVVDPAAVEVGHCPSGDPLPGPPHKGEGTIALEPALEGQPLIAGERALAVDADDLLHDEPHQRISVSEIGQRRRHAPEPAQQPGVSQDPIAECPALLLGALVLRPPDVLLDRHPAAGLAAGRVITRDRSTRHEDVAGQRTSVVADRLQPVAHPVSDGREGLRLEQRLVGSIGRHRVMRERLMKERVDDLMDPGAERAVDRVLERQHVGACVDALLPPGRLEEDAAALAIGELGRVGRRRADHLDPGFLDVFAQPVEEAKAEHGGRQGWDFEDRVTDLGRKARVHLHVVR